MVALISRQLADDVSRLVLKTEGFSIDDYLSLDGPYFVEYLDGCLQVLPMPTALHQAIAFVFANLLIAYSKPDALARTKLAPFRVKMQRPRVSRARCMLHARAECRPRGPTFSGSEPTWWLKW